MVFGNRNGFLTILTEPLSVAGETFVVKQVGLLFCFFFLYLIAVYVGS